ncbi:MAG: tRNA lysidine(34) synthetase TilS [Alphaproteobacteria bacterium]|nr:tRNA lysidine(34) synthetase TilS [Alphaproteobacteria bacterium]
MAALEPFETNPALAVAVSGGPDSLALALLAQTWVASNGGSVIALIVDHGLRPESRAEALIVGKWLKARGISHRILTWSGPKPTTALQSNARAARYALLTEFCRHRGVLHLLLGHQREDQAETILMRLERGSRQSGLAAMPILTERDGVRLLRPLLAVPRARLVAFLNALDQPYVDDPSNRNPAFGRVRHRMTLATLESDGFGAAPLAELAHRFGHHRHSAERDQHRIMARCVRLDPAGHALIALGPLATIDDRQVAVLFGAVIATIGGEVFAPSPDALDRVVRAWRQGSFGRGRTLGGCRLVMARDQSQLLVGREARACAPPIELSYDVTGWDGRFTVKSSASTGGRRNAMVMALGTSGILALRRAGQGAWLESIPAPARPALPIICGLDGQISAPHLNFQESGSVRVSGGIRPKLRLTPRRSLAEAPFLGTPGPAKGVSAGKIGVG